MDYGWIQKKQGNDAVKPFYGIILDYIHQWWKEEVYIDLQGLF